MQMYKYYYKEILIPIKAKPPSNVQEHRHNIEWRQEEERRRRRRSQELCSVEADRVERERDMRMEEEDLEDEEVSISTTDGVRFLASLDHFFIVFQKSGDEYASNHVSITSSYLSISFEFMYA